MDKSPKLSSSTSPVSPDGGAGAQRFFSQGKRIPKDVKRHCGMCKQHGVIVETRGHTCEYRNCNCEHCDLVRKRREIMSTQIRLRREQDKKFQRTTDITEANVFPGCTGEPDEKALVDTMNMCYFCQKCKNHSVLVWKKNHKKECRFSNCECEQCGLIDSRRALDRHIKKRRMVMKTGGTPAPKSPKTSSTCASEESSSSSDCSLSGLMSEKLVVANQNASPVLLETTSPLPMVLPHSPVPLTFQLPTTTVSPFLSVPSSPFLTPPMFYSTPNLFQNPFLMQFAPLDMQTLFQNIQNLNLSLGNKFE